MWRRYGIGAVVVGLLALGGWALAIERPPEDLIRTPPPEHGEHAGAPPNRAVNDGDLPAIIPSPRVAAVPPPDAGGKPHAEAAGTYAVAGGADGTVLVDTRSGKAWVLRPSMGRTFVWLPVKRLETDEEAQRWQMQMDQYARDQAERLKAGQ